MTPRLRNLITALALMTTGPVSGDHALGRQPSLGFAPTSNGFVVLAEHRFDPTVQRLLAVESLRAMPLAHGRLFYIVPSYVDPSVQSQQIRYLEYLLEKGERVAETPAPSK